ncbi:MAG: hypothetical protein E7091_04745 [Bacteroidales bacterium]|nr:hypothetical protein [Bacteroidales bacterium]
MKPTIKHLLAIASVTALVVACASIGSPDGGPYDENPPVFLGSTPAPFAMGVKNKRVTLKFDEYVKIEKAAEKVVVSPPQITPPIIKTNGKSIVVELDDSLKANTTYSIDFSDAIVDYNEGNPLGNFAFLFSTGDRIDTLAVSGTVLNASNLEPIKGILVGLYSDLADSAFTTKPFDRVSRTDADGHFTIRGIAPGSYRAYALQDANQNYIFDQKSEMIAYLDSLVVPYTEIRMHQDTTWIDSLTIDTIRTVPRVHYLPDNLVLMAFTETATQRYLVKTERPELKKFSVYFSTGSDSLPLLTPLNFADEDAYIVESSVDHDSITYWMRDTLAYYQDTLSLALTYEYTDTLGMLVPRTDTISLVAKKTRSKILQEEEKKRKEAQKEREKRMKRGDTIPETTPKTQFLSMKVSGGSSMDLTANVTIDFTEPIVQINDTAIRLFKKVDTLWVPEPHLFRQKKNALMSYELLGEWKPAMEYKVVLDSMAFTGLYGLHTKRQETTLKFKALDQYSTLFLTIVQPKPSYTVQLLDGDKVARQKRIEKGQADFYFLKPGTYYMRIFNDRNGNGVWDTGLYDSKEQAEEVYYFPGSIQTRENWDYTQEWDPTALPIDQQKPNDIKKQKSDTKERKSKNAEREAKKKK